MLDAASTWLAPSFGDDVQPGTQTPEWSQRKTDVALAAWTSLRHDATTMAHGPLVPWKAAAQPATEVGAPVFVEPHPEAIAKLVALVRQTARALVAEKLLAPGAPTLAVLDEASDVLWTALGVAIKEASDHPLTAADTASMQLLPARIATLEGALAEGDADAPLAIDVHIDDTSASALEECTGQVEEIWMGMREPGTHKVWLALGASIPHYETVQPASQRLTDDVWRSRLRTAGPSRAECDRARLPNRGNVNPPPPGPPWDLPVAEAPLAFVDLEMTGLDAAHDRVVEVCIDRVVGGLRHAFVNTLVHPGERLGGAAHVHGPPCRCARRGPPFALVADEVLAALSGAVLVAHAAVWDVRFLEAEVQRPRQDPRHPPLARYPRSVPPAFVFHSHALDSLCREFGIDRGQAHRAESDVRALRAVFDRCVAALAPSSVRDLWDVRVGDRHGSPGHRRSMRSRGQARRAGPCCPYPRRSVGQPSSCPWSCSTKSVPDLDPPGVVGYQLPEEAEDNCGPIAFCASNPRQHRPYRENPPMRRLLFAVLALCSAPLACGPSMGPQAGNRTPAASEWFGRAKTSYRAADFDDAREAVRRALAAAPSDAEIRELSARASHWSASTSPKRCV